MSAIVPVESRSLISRVQQHDRLRSYLTGITPEYATSLVRGASYSARGQTKLFETILARDPIAGTAADKRTGNLLSAAWTFAAVDEPTERAAAPLLAALPPAGFQRAIQWLGQAPLYGYAVAEIEWAPDSSVARLIPIPYDALDTTMGQLVLYLDGHATPIVEVQGSTQTAFFGQPDPEVRRRLIVVTADEHDPASAAILRRVVGPWLVSSFPIRDWARYLERFGNPLVTGKYPRGAPPNDTGQAAQDSLLEALEALHANARAAFPDDIVVELLADARADASGAFDKLLDRCERRIVRTILGQDTTTMAGEYASRASDEVRERVEDSIAERDAGMVQEALNEQLVKPLEAVKTKGRRAIKLTYNWKREQDPVSRSQVIVNVAAAGGMFDWAPVLEEFGLQPAGMPTPAAARALVAAFARQTTGTSGDALESLTAGGAEELMRHLRRALPALIRDAVPEDATPEEARRALGRLMTAENVGPLAEILERAILAARYNGQSNAQAWIERARKRRAAGS